MNDSLSILLATTILGIGGLGLYMYKSNDGDVADNGKETKASYDEDGLFGSNFWGLSDKKEKDDDDLESIDDSESTDDSESNDDLEEEDEAYIKKMVKLNKKEKATNDKATKKRQTLKNKKSSRRTY